MNIVSSLWKFHYIMMWNNGMCVCVCSRCMEDGDWNGKTNLPHMLFLIRFECFVIYFILNMSLSKFKKKTSEKEKWKFTPYQNFIFQPKHKHQNEWNNCWKKWHETDSEQRVLEISKNYISEKRTWNVHSCRKSE